MPKSDTFAFCAGHCVLFCCALYLGSLTAAHADSLSEAATPAEVEAQRALERTVQSIQLLLQSRADLRLALKNDEAAAKKAAKLDEIQQKELDARIERSRAKLVELDAQIQTLATGVPDSSFNLDAKIEFELESEVRKLIQPFVSMLSSATKEAREVEQLRQKLSVSNYHRELAQSALLRLGNSIANSEDKLTRERLAEIEAVWTRRLSNARDLTESLQRQLDARAEDAVRRESRAATAITEFILGRGRNLALGVFAFAAVWLLFRLLGRASSWMRKRHGIARSFPVRVLGLLYGLLSVTLALGAMLYVFNFFNDWLLIAAAAVIVFALGLAVVKVLPTVIEQLTLLLNLGAVQEGERVVLDGVPWLVARLDVYTELCNPSLAGGRFQVPVRQLVGHYSRPAGKEECWFPCEQGDWVKLQDGREGKVVLQTPELVQVEELDGAVITYPTSQFLAQVPKNLSHGYRVEVPFGIDYRHQSIATGEVIDRMLAFVEKGIRAYLPAAELIFVGIEFVRAGASSIDYEIEAHITGAAAPKFELVEREVNRLVVCACNEFGWTIPFNQLVVHRGDGT
jgi:small-conductance mechanosensitive channel